MSRAARVDANQAEIVAALRKAGASVQPLHTIGQGCPDILVGFRGKNYLAEIKDENKPPSKRQLTEDEHNWWVGWHGHVTLVKSVAGALAMIGCGNGQEAGR